MPHWQKDQTETLLPGYHATISLRDKANTAQAPKASDQPRLRLGHVFDALTMVRTGTSSAAANSFMVSA
jgi:hypothetical protein